MKPNQEITAKFWIAMILFFAFWLSFPVKTYLIESKIINDANVSGFYFICLVISILLYIVLSLRYSELKQKLSKESFFSKVSAQTITDYDKQINDQEKQIEGLRYMLKQKVTFSEELKKSFTDACNKIKELNQQKEDAVVEITELRSKNKALIERHKELGERFHKDQLLITYWKERALHQKHTKKVVDSEYWECIRSIEDFFTEGKQYKRGNKYKNCFSLISDNGIEYIVSSELFKPVKP